MAAESQMALKDMVGFSDFEAPDPNLINTCIHCGLCLNECPTYRLLRVEMDSPRGRIQLIKAVDESRMSLTEESFAKHIFLCLDCRGCETACPSGVQYGPLVEAARAQLTVAGNVPTGIKVANFVLRHVFRNPGRLRFVARLLRLYQRSGMQRLVRISGVLKLLPGDLAKAEAMAPEISDRFVDPGSIAFVSTQGDVRHRVAFLSGCIMSVAFSDVHEASLRVLARSGCEVVLPEGQVCCGALSYHNGDRDTARDLARANVEAFEAHEVDAIVVNSAGCGSTMKEWGDILADDPEFADRAKAVAAKVQDFSEWLARIGIGTDLGAIDERVTYQDACHLRHAQKIADQPRDLIGSIPGVELVEMRNSVLCCGNAGIYSALNTEISMGILDEKLDNIAHTEATTIVTTNPGCQLHIGSGLKARGGNARIVHIAQLLDEAIAKAEVPTAT